MTSDPARSQTTDHSVYGMAALSLLRATILTMLERLRVHGNGVRLD